MTTNTDAHTCSYYCERPECIKRQRDELRDRLESDLASAPPSAPEPEVHSYDPTDQRESVTIRWPDGKRLGYVLDRTRYTDNLPPSATTGVDFAAVASILRRAMRDGVHYGYRRDFILQQALALEALSQQPAAVGGADAQAAEIEALRAEAERLRRLVQERDTMLGKRLCSGTNADGKPRCLVLAEERALAERLAEALEICLEMEERPTIIKMAREAIAAYRKGGDA